MKKFILIVGGARSGKSSYAVELAKGSCRRAAFIATATSSDAEMKKKITRHRSLRPRHWKTIEEGRDISAILPKLNHYAVAVIDCLGLLISNLMADGLKDREIERKIRAAIDSMRESKLTIILVSNETGLGIVPDNPLARRFRDLLGLANQMAAQKADEVIFMQSGIPLRIKGGRKNAEIK